ncbi:hypothetical protein OJ998_11505 [Solirubrobacter taibaiensis]|nr:hypothetical protein [Solirubrobacter taibaiensis]
MTITEAYATFLRHRDGQSDLVAALQRAGHGLEAELLMDWTGSGVRPTETSDGRRAWVGPVLPATSRPGDLWLDVVELMPMLRVPDPLGWIALRPVERWQFAGFLTTAKLRGAGHKVGGMRTMKAERLTDGPETSPVTRVLRDEASLYAQWFGKFLADRTDWQLVAESIDPATLWGGVPAEWGGEEWEGAYSVTTLETLALEDDLPDELIFRAHEAPDDVGFRTFVRDDIGLFTETEPAEAIGARVKDQAIR